MEFRTKVLFIVLAVTWLPWFLMAIYVFTAPLWGCDPNFKGASHCQVGNWDLNYFSSAMSFYSILGFIFVAPLGAIAVVVYAIGSLLRIRRR